MRKQAVTPTSSNQLVGRRQRSHHAALEARREKVKAITLVRQFPDDLFISDCAMWTIESRATKSLAHQSNYRTAGHHAGRASHFVDFFPGGNTGEVTPVPIPNTEVKLSRADGTAGASLWESRTLPGF